MTAFHKFYSYIVLLCIFYVSAIEIKVRPLDCKDKRSVIDKHNAVRKILARGDLKTQPKASNMAIMMWDKELAEKAEKLVKKGKMQHSVDLTIPSKRFKVGENLFISSYTPSSSTPNRTDWDEVVQDWFDEHKIYKYNSKNENFRETGHYTQVVWANTVYVGCAVATIKKAKSTSVLVACNYGPAGNINNQYPYKKGAGCENLCCTGNCSRRYGAGC